MYIGCEVSTTEPCPHIMDEFRVYKKVLTYQQVVDNYNGGIGQNPGITENLIV